MSNQIILGKAEFWQKSELHSLIDMFVFPLIISAWIIDLHSDRQIIFLQESLKIKNVSVWDKLFSTPKDIRVKAKNKRKLG